MWRTVEAWCQNRQRSGAGGVHRRARNGFRRGGRIGWVIGSDLFLDPAASYHVAQDAAGTERLPMSQQTLRHRLQESGLLASVDQGGQMVQVRRTMEGSPRQVLHLKATDLAEDLQEAG